MISQGSLMGLRNHNKVTKFDRATREKVFRGGRKAELSSFT